MKLAVNIESDKSFSGKYIVCNLSEFQELLTNGSSGKWVFTDHLDLNGDSITFPPNVSIEFSNGSLSNYDTITGDNTLINALNESIFKGSGDIIGTWKNTRFQVGWFNIIKNDKAESTSNTAKIRKCLKAAPPYSDVIIPEGLYYIDNDIVPEEGQKLIFHGTLKLYSTDIVIRMISIIRPFIELINPSLDMNRGENINNGISGTQSVISNYGNGTNCKISGGKIINGMDNFYQGGRTNLIFENTEMENCGEHAFYVNGIGVNPTDENYGSLLFRNLTIKNVALDSSNS